MSGKQQLEQKFEKAPEKKRKKEREYISSHSVRIQLSEVSAGRIARLSRRTESISYGH